MPWPFTVPPNKDDSSISSTITDPRVLAGTAGLTVTSLLSIRFYKRYLRRIPSAEHIKPEFLRKRTIFGKVTSVGDGDNFRVYHTPGGRLAGWGWARRVPQEKEKLTGQTVRRKKETWKKK
jgi:endonuclease YncB( thermonuclease family)